MPPPFVDTLACQGVKGWQQLSPRNFKGDFARENQFHVEDDGVVTALLGREDRPSHEFRARKRKLVIDGSVR